MGGYRSEDEALIGLARQLTDAYGEARRREDQDFACDAVDEFLQEYRDDAPSEALLAILDLPLTAETYPLVDEAQTLLAGRGPAVVELLLEALLGEVYDPDGPAPERAAEALDMMDRRDSVQGLVQVLCGRADDDVKSAAVDGLVALGAFAEPRLIPALDDPRGGDWARAAVEQIRYQAAQPEGLEEYAAGEDDVPGDAGALFGLDDAGGDDVYADDGAGGDTDGDPGAPAEDGPAFWAAGEVGSTAGDDARAEEEGQRGLGADAASASGHEDGPDKERVDDAYDEFLRRYRDESGGDSAAS